MVREIPAGSEGQTPAPIYSSTLGRREEVRKRQSPGSGQSHPIGALPGKRAVEMPKPHQLNTGHDVTCSKTVLQLRGSCGPNPAHLPVCSLQTKGGFGIFHWLKRSKEVIL